MSGGYGQASSRARGIATVQKKPLFYDYSEDFEDIIEPPPIVPIAPIPRRVSIAFRPVVFQNNSGEGPESMEDVQNEFEAYLQEGANASHHPEGGTGSLDAPIQPISLPPGGAGVISQQPADGHLDSHPSAEMAAPAGDCRDLTPVLDESVLAENTSADKDMGQAKESTVVEITSDASTLDDASEPKTPAFTAGVPFHEVMVPKEDVDPCRDSREGRITVQNFRLSQGHETLPVLSKSTPTSFPTPHQTDDVVSTLPRVSCHPRHDSRFYSLGSGLSDLASFVQQVDQHFQTPGPEDPEIVCSESQEPRPRTQTNEAAATIKDSPRPGEYNEPGPGKATTAVSHPPRVSSLRENRRKATPLRVNTAVDEPHQYQVVSTRDGPTLTPQPISPAKILRVKNSIPQLMKALPPLPGYAPAPESPFGPAVVPMEFEPFEISQLTDARSTLIDAFQAEEAPKGYDAFIFDRNAHKPRLKLKHAASFAVEHERSSRREYTTPKSATRPHTSVKRPTTSTAAASATEYSTAPVKRRLPIKISRPMLAPLLPDDAGTVKRRPGIQKSSTVSELVSQEPIDLFSSAVALRAAVANSHVSSAQQRIFHNRVHVDTPMVKVTPVARIRQVPADAETRGTSLDAHMDILRVPSVDSQPGPECEIQSFFSDNSIVKPRQGLRTRISNLKSKLAESRNHHRSPLSNPQQDDRLEDRHRKDDNRDGVGASLAADSQPTGTHKELSASTSNSKAHPQVIAKRGVRSKLEKFMKGAKHKLRTWGKAKRRID